MARRPGDAGGKPLRADAAGGENGSGNSSEEVNVARSPEIEIAFRGLRGNLSFALLFWRFPYRLG
jgi:hypothetical protein